jgi:hypothetical protein
MEMSDAFFQKLFGDSEPTGLGSGWVSGVSSVFFGMLGPRNQEINKYPTPITIPHHGPSQGGARNADNST